MEENMNVTTEMAEQVVEAATEAVAKVAENLPATTAVARTSNTIGKDIAIGGAGLLGGILIKTGYDKWVAPKMSEAWAKRKAKKEAKKAEKQAKKNAKKEAATGKADTANKPAPAEAEVGINPMDVDTKIPD